MESRMEQAGVMVFLLLLENAVSRSFRPRFEEGRQKDLEEKHT